MNLGKPRDDLGIARSLQVIDLARLHAIDLEGRLDIAQGHGQQCHAVLFSKSLNDAEGRSRKFCQRWHGSGGDFEGETVGVAQAAARCVFEVFGQADRELALLGQQGLK